MEIQSAWGCAVHYGAHRHGDGTWRAAKNCPIDDETGRLLGLVARQGHGIYPRAGVQARVFLVANDVTANTGRRWGCRECIILAQSGSGLASGVTLEKLPVVKDRGAPYTEPFEGTLAPLAKRELTASQRKRQATAMLTGDNPTVVGEVQVWWWHAPRALGSVHCPCFLPTSGACMFTMLGYTSCVP